MNIEQIALTDIDADERLREVDLDAADFIAASMAEYGLRQPIEVRKSGKRYKLIAGGHRLAAAKKLEWADIPAVVLKANELEAQLLEIDENLFRRELSPLDRSTSLAKRKEVYEALHPETKAGGDRKSDQMLNLEHLIPTFSQETAERLGFSRQTIDRSIRRYRHIAPDVRQKIVGTWLADSGSQLDELAKQEPDTQRQIADFVVQWPNVRKVSEIVRQLAGRPKPTPPGALEKTAAIWRKASPAERKQIIEFFAPHLPGYQPEERAAA